MFKDRLIPNLNTYLNPVLMSSFYGVGLRGSIRWTMSAAIGSKLLLGPIYFRNSLNNLSKSDSSAETDRNKAEVPHCVGDRTTTCDVICRLLEAKIKPGLSKKFNSKIACGTGGAILWT